MRIDFAVRRQRRLSLTPLIDVIFLLLLFFMLSSTFSRFSEVKLGGGEGGAGATSRPDAILSVDAGSLRLNGDTLVIEDLGGELAALKQAGAGRLLVIVASGAVSQDFVAAMAEISRIGLSVSVARSRP